MCTARLAQHSYAQFAPPAATGLVRTVERTCSCSATSEAHATQRRTRADTMHGQQQDQRSILSARHLSQPDQLAFLNVIDSLAAPDTMLSNNTDGNGEVTAVGTSSAATTWSSRKNSHKTGMRDARAHTQQQHSARPPHQTLAVAAYSVGTDAQRQSSYIPAWIRAQILASYHPQTVS
eukprot:8009619-Alexandrium_andersonii.AAC.1